MAEAPTGRPGAEEGAHGAVRLGDHPRLGPLPAAEVVTFAFDGRAMEGRAGEALIAALLAEGVRVLRTMPRSGEGRGGWCLVGRCADCLVAVDGVPGVRACLEPVRAGMRVATQVGIGAWPADDPEASRP